MKLAHNVVTPTAAKTIAYGWYINQAPIPKNKNHKNFAYKPLATFFSVSKTIGSAKGTRNSQVMPNDVVKPDQKRWPTKLSIEANTKNIGASNMALLIPEPRAPFITLKIAS